MEQPENFLEKRISPRIPLNIPARLSISDNQKELSGYTHDISQEGLGLILNEHLPTGTNLLVHLKLPDGKEEIVRQGIIVWSKKDPGLSNFRAGISLQGEKLRTASLSLRIILSRLNYRDLN